MWPSGIWRFDRHAEAGMLKKWYNFLNKHAFSCLIIFPKFSARLTSQISFLGKQLFHESRNTIFWDIYCKNRLPFFCVKNSRDIEAECRNPQTICSVLVFGDNAHETARFMYVFSYDSNSIYANLCKFWQKITNPWSRRYTDHEGTDEFRQPRIFFS